MTLKGEFFTEYSTLEMKGFIQQNDFLSRRTEIKRRFATLTSFLSEVSPTLWLTRLLTQKGGSQSEN